MKYVGITIHGHYLRANPLAFVFGQISADGVGFGADSIFERVEFAGNEIALRTLDGRYVAADDRHLVLQSAVDADCRFTEVWWPDDRISLRSHRGFFVCAENGGGGIVVPNRPEAADWEKFYYEVPPPELLPENIGVVQQGQQQEPERLRVIDVDAAAHRLPDTHHDRVVDVDAARLPVADVDDRIHVHRPDFG